jgi:hypothetical protein
MARSTCASPMTCLRTAIPLSYGVFCCDDILFPLIKAIKMSAIKFDEGYKKSKPWLICFK